MRTRSLFAAKALRRQILSILFVLTLVVATSPRMAHAVEVGDPITNQEAYTFLYKFLGLTSASYPWLDLGTFGQIIVDQRPLAEVARTLAYVDLVESEHERIGSADFWWSRYAGLSTTVDDSLIQYASGALDVYGYYGLLGSCLSLSPLDCALGLFSEVTGVSLDYNDALIGLLADVIGSWNEIAFRANVSFYVEYKRVFGVSPPPLFPIEGIATCQDYVGMNLDAVEVCARHFTAAAGAFLPSQQSAAIQAGEDIWALYQQNLQLLAKLDWQARQRLRVTISARLNALNAFYAAYRSGQGLTLVPNGASLEVCNVGGAYVYNTVLHIGILGLSDITLPFLPPRACASIPDPPELADIDEVEMDVEGVDVTCESVVAGDVVARFTGAPDGPVDAPAVLTLDASTSLVGDGDTIVGWYWSSADGTVVAEGPMVTVTISEIGPVDVYLEVETANGSYAYDYRTIELTNPVTAQGWAGPTKGMAPVTTTFDASDSRSSTGTIVSWQWDFGDGEAKNAETTTHVYRTSGEFKGSLRVVDSNGYEGAWKFPLDIEGPTVALFEANPTTALVGYEVAFDARESYSKTGRDLVSWQWEFGDGSGDSSGPVVAYTYSVGGLYDVRLTVLDEDGVAGTTNFTLPVREGSGGPLYVGDRYYDHDVTWSPAYSPVIVEGLVIVGPGARLTIAAGTRVEFAWGTILVSGGELAIDGTEEQPVEIVGVGPDREPIGGIDVGDDVDESLPSRATIAHAVIEGAGLGVFVGSTLLVSDSSIIRTTGPSETYWTGVYASAGATVEIARTEFLDDAGAGCLSCNNEWSASCYSSCAAVQVALLGECDIPSTYITMYGNSYSTGLFNILYDSSNGYYCGDGWAYLVDNQVHLDGGARYDLYGGIKIPPGSRFTLPPGSRLCASGLSVEGTLVAEGLADDPVRLGGTECPNTSGLTVSTGGQVRVSNAVTRRFSFNAEEQAQLSIAASEFTAWKEGDTACSQFTGHADSNVEITNSRVLADAGHACSLMLYLDDDEQRGRFRLSGNTFAPGLKVMFNGLYRKPAFLDRGVVLQPGITYGLYRPLYEGGAQFTIPAGEAFVLPGGARLELDWLHVMGTFTAEGTANAPAVIDGDGSSVLANSSGEIRLHYADITDVVVNTQGNGDTTARYDISNCVFNGSRLDARGSQVTSVRETTFFDWYETASAIEFAGHGSMVVVDSVFSSVNRADAMSIRVSDDEPEPSVHLSGNTLAAGARIVLLDDINAGRLTESFEIQASLPYVMEGSFFVPPDHTFTIPSATEVDVYAAYLSVAGTLDAAGMPGAPVRLSATPDEITWDSAEVLAGGIARFVHTDATGLGSLYVELDGRLHIEGSSFSGCGGITLDDGASAEIVDSDFSDWFGSYGVDVVGRGDVTISGTSFTAPAGEWAIRVGSCGESNVANLTLHDNTFAPEIGVIFEPDYNCGGALAETLSLQEGGLYALRKTHTVSQGASFDLPRGSTFDLGDGNLYVDGALHAHGSRAHPITLRAASCAGKERVQVNGEASLHEVTIDGLCGLVVGGYGVVDASNTRFEHTSVGLSVGYGGTAAVVASEFTSNTLAISAKGTASVTVGSSRFEGNAQAIDSTTSIPVSAEGCWWGAPSGPRDTSDDVASGGLYNPDGAGDAVSDHVDYAPWIGTLPEPVCTPTAFQAKATDAAITATWSPATGSAPLGYWLQLRRIDGGSTTILAVDGSEVSSKAKGLTNGVTYLVSLKAFNAVGEASDPTPEITAVPDGTPPTVPIVTLAPSWALPGGVVAAAFHATDPQSATLEYANAASKVIGAGNWSDWSVSENATVAVPSNAVPGKLYVVARARNVVGLTSAVGAAPIDVLDPELDEDDDGLSNAAEALAGSDPLDANSPGGPGSPPVANAGPDRDVDPGWIELTGSASGTAPLFTYTWVQTSGPQATLVDADGSVARFLGLLPGPYTFALTVEGDGAASLPDSTTITVRDLAPLALASSPVRAVVGETIVLDGSACADPNGTPIRYAWTPTAGPAVSMMNADTPTPSFVASVAATYRFSLVVESGGLSSAPESIDVEVAPLPNLPPVAAAIGGGSGIVGDTFYLDGTASHEPDATELTYSWHQIVGPTTAMTNSGAARTTVRPSGAGFYQFELTVSDGTYSSEPATLDVVVHNPADMLPTSVAAAVSEAWPGEHVVLDGTASSDPENEPLSFRWVQASGPWVALEKPDSAQAGFRPVSIGAYRFVLVVSDGRYDSTPAFVSVAVVSPPIAALDLSVSAVQLPAGTALQWHATTSDAEGAPFDVTTSVTLDEAPAGILDAVAPGWMLAQSVGEVSLTARLGDVASNTVVVRVTEALALVPSPPWSLVSGETMQLTASGGTAPYTFSTTDPKVAEATASGLVTATGRGPSEACDVRVADASGATVRFTPLMVPYDNDDDGWADWIEVQLGYDPHDSTDPAAGTDLDGDGYLAIQDGGDDCDDSDPLSHPGTIDTCDGIDNDCSGAVDDGSGARCDDGDACNGLETCDAILGCVNGSALNCDDQHECSVDSCDPVAGCQHDIGACGCTADSDCDDGNACTGTETCQLVTNTCVSSAALVCDDGNPCTTDACDERIGCAAEVSQGAPCDDEDACTYGEACDAIGACTDGLPVACPAAGACQVPSCDAPTGCTLVASTDGTPCFDANPCTSTACQAGACVVTLTTAGCCEHHDDCATPSELCVSETHACAPASCHACVTDDDCGAATNRCVNLVSGSYCGVDCSADHDACPADTLCLEVEPAAWQCLPVQGDCACVPTGTVACLDGDVVALDSCGVPGTIEVDCQGRGCVGGDCCVTGTHEYGSACVTDAVEPEPDVVGPDAIGPDAADTETPEFVPEAVDTAQETHADMNADSVADAHPDDDSSGADTTADGLADFLEASDAGHDHQVAPDVLDVQALSDSSQPDASSDLQVDASEVGSDVTTSGSGGGGCVVAASRSAARFSGIVILFLVAVGIVACPWRSRRKSNVDSEGGPA